MLRRSRVIAIATASRSASSRGWEGLARLGGATGVDATATLGASVSIGASARSGTAAGSGAVIDDQGVTTVRLRTSTGPALADTGGGGGAGAGAVTGCAHTASASGCDDEPPVVRLHAVRRACSCSCACSISMSLSLSLDALSSQASVWQAIAQVTSARVRQPERVRRGAAVPSGMIRRARRMVCIRRNSSASAAASIGRARCVAGGDAAAVPCAVPHNAMSLAHPCGIQPWGNSFMDPTVDSRRCRAEGTRPVRRTRMRSSGFSPPP